MQRRRSRKALSSADDGLCDARRAYTGLLHDVVDLPVLKQSLLLFRFSGERGATW